VLKQSEPLKKFSTVSQISHYLAPMFDDYYQGTYRLGGRYFVGLSSALRYLRREGWSQSDARTYLTALRRQW